MQNPYNYHAPVDNDSMFFGREEMLARLVSRLREPIPLSAVIFGGRRCGKTSLLNKLKRMLDESTTITDRRFLVCSLDLQERGYFLTCSDDFFLWVLEELGKALAIERGLEAELMVEALQQRYREKNRRGAVSAFINAFQSIGEQSKLIRLVILVDESENILAFELGEDLRPNLRHLLTNSPIKRDIALVMAGSTKMYTKVKERDSPLENVFDHYLLHTLSREATLALARKPNADRLSEQAAEAIWEQTGGQPCMAQYILHELWYEFDGELQGVAAEDVYDIADTFDERTQHFATWAKTLDRSGDALYCFLIEQNAPVAYPVIRQHFYQMTQNILRGALDALVYHGLVHCHGEGRGRRYSLAGTMYRDWFLTAGHLNTPEQTEAHTTPAVPQVLIERVEQHMTTIAGSVIGPVAVGGGDAVDQRESQGPLYKPQNTVEQNFDKKEDKRK